MKKIQEQICDNGMYILEDEEQRRSLEREFCLILKQYDNVITHSLYKYKFWKTLHDKEEYSQEIYLLLWKAFIKCRAKGPMVRKTMPAWIMTVAQYAIYGFRRNLHKKQELMAYTDNDFVFERAEKPYDEDQITSIMLMVTRLPDSDRLVIEMVLDERNLREESLKIGMRETYFSQKYQKALKYMRTQAGKYFENYKFDVSKLFTRQDYMGRSKAVVKLDDCGEIINEFLSITEASVRSDISPKTLDRLLKSDDGYYNGFFWRYKEGPIVEFKNDDKTLALAI